MPLRAFVLFGHNPAPWVVAVMSRVLMPLRAFVLFGPVSGPQLNRLLGTMVLMPLRAFVLFGQLKQGAERFGAGESFNALAGICAFWTYSFCPTNRIAFIPF